MIKILVTGFGIILTLAGCGAGGDTPVTVTPDRYQPIRPEAESAGPGVQLPGAEGFAIHDKNSEQSPGQAGTAASASDARPDGAAFCKASASKGGAASSGFVLGAALHNESSGALPVAVTCDIEYAYALDTSAAGGRKTTGTISFMLEAREQETGKLLFQHPLASLSGYEDNLKRSDQQRVQFTATVSPMVRWRITLAGRAEAQTSEDGKSEGELRVTRCQMTIKPIGAPASAPASQHAS